MRQGMSRRVGAVLAAGLLLLVGCSTSSTGDGTSATVATPSTSAADSPTASAPPASAGSRLIRHHLGDERVVGRLRGG